MFKARLDELWAIWSSEDTLSQPGAWNYVIVEVPSNPNHPVILWSQRKWKCFSGNDRNISNSSLKRWTEINVLNDLFNQIIFEMLYYNKNIEYQKEKSQDYF